MRIVAALLLAFLPGCDVLSQGEAEVGALKAEQAVLEARVDVLEQRLAALEGPAAPDPAAVVVAPASPTPRPLVVPAVPAPPPTPAPVVPAGPVGRVTVSSPRDGLAIWVDGAEISQVTPAVLTLASGRHRVRVEGYDEQEVKVIEGESVLVVPR